jgi:hypothetical protein
MEKFSQGVVTLAAIAVVVFVAIYASEHVTCFNFFGITKGCVTH